MEFASYEQEDVTAAYFICRVNTFQVDMGGIIALYMWEASLSDVLCIYTSKYFSSIEQGKECSEVDLSHRKTKVPQLTLGYFSPFRIRHSAGIDIFSQPYKSDCEGLHMDLMGEIILSFLLLL